MRYNLPRTILGRTGLSVTRLGVGGAYCRTVEGYRAALDCGVNYVDTARAYQDGKDEEIIGQAIVGQRDKLVLATKTLQRDASSARRDLETSLTCLRTDYVDIWQLHHLNTEAERSRALGPGGAYEAALKAREEGLIRFIGVTGHDWVEIGKAVATGLFDTVLCWYNCAMKEPEQLVFPHALTHGTGVVIMNASRNEKLFGGPEGPDPADFYRYVLSHEAVHVTLMGLRDVSLFQRIAQALAERHTLEAEERQRLEEYGAQMRSTGKLG
jgi:aryl-alcohol dehydrogenase-like predicted oxidoreductase